MTQGSKIRAYGISASSVNDGIEELTGVHPGRKAVLTKETGRIFGVSEMRSGGSAGYCDCGSGGGGPGDGEGLLICIIAIAVLMIMVAVVWTVIMIAFSILTVGGFLKRRYRTVVAIEQPNREFLGKLAVLIFRKGGVLEYPFQYENYDAWVKRSLKLHMRLKYVRQISFFFGIGWGWVEVFFKVYELLLGTVIKYDLWPLRIPMIIIFVPLLLYSPIMEMQFANLRNEGEELVMRLLHDEYSFSPDHRMSFVEPPKVVPKVSAAAMKKIDF
ncbi:MAG: hypothetical protein ACTSVR_12915 [Candidatus Thorarchaeota archaeon]